MQPTCMVMQRAAGTLAPLGAGARARAAPPRAPAVDVASARPPAEARSSPL